MGIAGGLWRVKPEPFCLLLGAAEAFLIPVRRREFWPDGDLGSSNRPFPRRCPRADVSERGSPGLPGAGDRKATGEPSRANRLGMSNFVLARPSLAARNGCCRCWLEKQPEGRSPRGRRRSTCARTKISEWPKRWSVRAMARRNSHCAPTMGPGTRAVATSGSIPPPGRSAPGGVCPVTLSARILSAATRWPTKE